MNNTHLDPVGAPVNLSCMAAATRSLTVGARKGMESVA